jgi:hypothetical protein
MHNCGFKLAKVQAELRFSKQIDIKINKKLKE